MMSEACRMLPCKASRISQIIQVSIRALPQSILDEHTWMSLFVELHTNTNANRVGRMTANVLRGGRIAQNFDCCRAQYACNDVVEYLHQ